MGIFIYEKKKYRIDAAKRIDCAGDINPKKKKILIDKDIPEKFHGGIAVHEIEERKNLDRGHTYVFSHNEAQKKESVFYEKIYGPGQGLKTLEEEEALVLRLLKRRSCARARAVPAGRPAAAAPAIQIKDGRRIIFERKKYRIDAGHRLIGTLVDVYEKGRVVYFDKSVAEKFFAGLAIYELTARKFLKKGLGWSASQLEADRAEKKYYRSKYGIAEAEKIFNRELALQTRKFEQERKNLGKRGGHRAVYEGSEILPK